MKFPVSPRVWPLLLALVITATLQAALAVGGVAFTKRIETKLLAEPNPFAVVSGQVALGKQLAVQEIRGSWLLVSEGTNTGWVYAGNIAETKPAEGTGTAGLGPSASETTATAATRGLSEEAEAYATRRNLTDAHTDLTWLYEQSAAVSVEDVAKFLQEEKRGEFK